jgi:hypothetical protein
LFSWPTTPCPSTYPCRLVSMLSFAPLTLVVGLASIIQANSIFLCDFASDFTLGAWGALVLHALHHLHWPSTNIWNINPLIYYFPHPGF